MALSQSLRWRLLLGIVLLMLGLKFIALFVTAYHWDTGYYLDISINFVENGQLNPAMWRIPPDENILTSGGGGYGTILLPLWFSVFGFTATAGRILMYLASLLSLAGVIWVANAWWGREGAYWTAAFGATGVMFFHNYTVRMDALSVLAYVIVLVLHVVAVRRGQRWLHFVVGVLAIATTEFHIIGLAFAGALALYLGIQQIEVWRTERRLFASRGGLEYLAGATLAGLVYLWVHVLPDPEAYFLIPQLCAICTPVGPVKEVQQLVAWGLFAPLELGLFTVAVYALVRNRVPNRAHYLWIIAGFWLGYAIVSPPVEFTYLGHRWFLVALGLGGAFGFGVQRVPRLQYVGLAVLLVLAVLRLGEVARGDLRYREYPLSEERVETILAEVPPAATVLAPPPYYRALLGYRDFATIHRDAIYTITLQGITHDAYLAQVNPDVIIFEQQQLLSDEMQAAVTAYIANEGLVERVPDLWIRPGI